MDRSSFLRLRWLAGIMLAGVILLLTARLGGPPPPDANGLSPAGRLASLVTCVLPAAVVAPPLSSPSAVRSGTSSGDCTTIEMDPFRAAWISPC
jgi:hypothetical protein